MHFFVQFVAKNPPIKTSRGFFRLPSLKCACSHCRHDPKQTKHSVMIPNVIKHPRRQSPDDRKPSAKDLKPAPRFLHAILTNAFKEEKAQKNQKQNQSKNTKLTKNL
jgi:hypothetical protein